MAIDKSGKYWVGSDARDLDEYLRELTADAYPVDRIVHAKCECGNARFRLEVDSDEGCARRSCARCRRRHLICDSEEHWSDAEPEPIVCPCGAKEFEIAAGFHHHDASVKWITVGARCATCGMLGAT